jgi:hypothetical protein
VVDPGVRASDDDRRRVATELERHTAAGRLTLDEFSDRVGRVYLASTHGELAALTGDLPALPPPTPSLGWEQRSLVIAITMALATIAILGLVLAIFKH